MKVAVIINKLSGSVTDNDTFTESSLIEDFGNHNIKADIFLIEGKLIKEKVEAIKHDYDSIVAAGGDGTLSSVASCLVYSGIPLGVLPLGTLNHFAKDLNIPLTIPEAIETIAKGTPQLVDIGEVNGTYFINNSSIGLYPKTVIKRTEIMERIGGKKWIAMLSALISVLKKFPLISVHIDSDEAITLTRTPFVFIGNNEYEMHLFSMGNRASLSEGYLSMYTPKYSKRILLLKFFFMMLINKLDQQKDFMVTLAKSITLTPKKKIVAVSSDGEVRFLNTPLHYKIHPKALTVIIGSKE